MVSYRNRKDVIFSNSNNNSKYNRNVLERKIFKTYLDVQIKLLLYRIHNLYPTLFTMKHLKEELTLYNKWKPNINLINHETINKKTKKTNTSKITTQNNNKKTNNKQCISRVYNNKNIILKNEKDNKIINENEMVDNYIFGRRCYGKCIGNTNYCFVHLKHNPHGDFDKPPTKQIKDHFIMLYNNKQHRIES